MANKKKNSTARTKWERNNFSFYENIALFDVDGKSVFRLYCSQNGSTDTSILIKPSFVLAHSFSFIPEQDLQITKFFWESRSVYIYHKSLR